jgi:glycosyltransferase involved in cell wall biosynthesis
MEKELISVIIPVYNNVGLLMNTLQSVLKQTYLNFEVWAIDDCSEIDIHLIYDYYQRKRHIMGYTPKKASRL